MSAASVSRTGLPLSQLSATASISRCSSIRSAIRFSTRARSASVASPQAVFAACAASSANSMSSAVERATCVKAWPVTGLRLSEYAPFTGAIHCAADEVLVALLHLDRTARLSRCGVRLLFDGGHRRCSSGLGRKRARPSRGGQPRASSTSTCGSCRTRGASLCRYACTVAASRRRGVSVAPRVRW